MNYEKDNWTLELMQTPLPTLTQRLADARRDCERVAMESTRLDKRRTSGAYIEHGEDLSCLYCYFTTKSLTEMVQHHCN